jgi:hypothetical protein
LIRALSPQLWRLKARWNVIVTQHRNNSYAAFGRKDNTNTAQKHKVQWHLTTLARKGRSRIYFRV